MGDWIDTSKGPVNMDVFATIKRLPATPNGRAACYLLVLGPGAYIELGPEDDLRLQMWARKKGVTLPTSFASA